VGELRALLAASLELAQAVAQRFVDELLETLVAAPAQPLEGRCHVFVE
jgi:hypothetical protein